MFCGKAVLVVGVGGEFALAVQQPVLVVLEGEQRGLGVVLEGGVFPVDLQQVQFVVGELVVLQAEADQVGVFERLVHRHARRLVHPQTPLHKPQRVLLYLPEVAHFGRLGSLRLGQLHSFELGVPAEAVPLLRGEASQQLGDDVQLVKLVVSGEHRLSVH